ncbi:hypothetical protein B0H14DRAFT_2223619, partial [Mycena olivaceomarginata]
SHLVYYTIDRLIAKARKQQATVKVLRLARINDGTKIASRTRALTLHKQWVRAVASGEVLRVDGLAAKQLNRSAGIRSIMKHSFDAANHLYKPLNYTEQDYLRGLLIWRLGSARLAGIAHRALDLPSVSTLRHHSIVPNLIASHTKPEGCEIETNLRACFKDIEERVRDDGVVHQSVMVDESKAEERLRWDSATNHILGLCREHSGHLPLEFKSEAEPKLVMTAL